MYEEGRAVPPRYRHVSPQVCLLWKLSVDVHVGGEGGRGGGGGGGEGGVLPRYRHVSPQVCLLWKLSVDIHVGGEGGRWGRGEEGGRGMCHPDIDMCHHRYACHGS